MPPLIAVAIVVFLEIVCLGAIIPTLPDYVTSLGGGAAWTGLLFALVAGPKIFFNPLFGRLSDKRGRKPVLILLTCGAILGSATWALSPMLGRVIFTPLTWVTISRLIYGIFASQATLAYAVASDVSTPQKRAAAMGVLGAAFGLGLTVGFPLGGIIGSHSLPAVGWLCAICEMLGLLTLIVFMRETRPEISILCPPHTHSFQKPRALMHVALEPAVLAVLIVVLVVTAGYSVLTPTLRDLTADWYGYTLQQTSHAFLVWGVVGVFVQGGLIRPTVKHLGEKRTLIVGSVILAASMALLAVHPAVAGLWAALVGMALGGGLAVPASSSLISHQVPPHEQGTVHGLNQSGTALGRTVGYLVAGLLYAHVSIASPYWAGAALLVVGLIPLMFLAHSRAATASAAH